MVGTATPDLELWPIGNCQVSALVDREGAVVWACVPRVDGDPVFCSLLNGDNRDTGIWRFELVGQVSATQEYIRNTPILVTRLEAADGSVVEITDFCPRFERRGRMYRPVSFIRLVRPVKGAPQVRVALRLADALDLAEDKIRLIARYVGGGFGSKLGISQDVVAASIAAMSSALRGFG